MSGKVVPLRTGDYLQERNRLLLANCNRRIEFEMKCMRGEVTLEQRVIQRAELLCEMMDINERFPLGPS